MCVEKYEQDPNVEKHDMHAGSGEYLCMIAHIIIFPLLS